MKYTAWIASTVVIVLVFVTVVLLSISGGLSQTPPEDVSKLNSAEANPLPKFALFGPNMSKVKEMLGHPDKELVIPIINSPHQYEYTHYASPDLLFESIDGILFEVKMGQNSKSAVLGVSVGDIEEKVRLITMKKTPDDRQKIFIEDAVVPLLIKARPKQDSENVYTLNKLTSSRNYMYSMEVEDFDPETKYVLLNIRGEDLPKELEGWVPVSLLKANDKMYVRGRQLVIEYLQNARVEYHFEYKGKSITYRLRNGKISLIIISSTDVKPKVGPILRVTGTPYFELEHIEHLFETWEQ
jgi:hypothetical protein